MRPLARLPVLALALVSGCSPDGDDPCRAAAAHVAACAGTTLPAATGCDPDVARALLALDCAALAPAARAASAARASSAGQARPDSLTDVLRGIACAAGIVRACDAPACTDEPYPARSLVCADYIAVAGCGGCQFYACREAEHSCGASGYYVGYAQKYCERFLAALRPRMSPAGQRFLDAGRDCLMRFVDAELPADDACDDVKQRAFASHVACYHDNGFCELPLADRWLLVNTVDPADFDLVAALRTGLSCL
jgi:hypothetical protein